MKNRISQNKIRSLVTNTGEVVQSMKAIEEEMVGFYKELLGSSTDAIPPIQPDIIKEGNVLDKSQQLKLIKPITVEEVHNALKGIDDLKAPGCDGFNSMFFKKSRGITSQEITKAVLQFFNTAEISLPINITIATLILKIHHPSTIKELRPIFCYTMLYKIISKILTNGLQGLMDYLVHKI